VSSRIRQHEGTRRHRVNAWSCLLPDDADLGLCRGLGDAIKSGSHNDQLPTKGYLEQNNNNGGALWLQMRIPRSAVLKVCYQYAEQYPSQTCIKI